MANQLKTAEQLQTSTQKKLDKTRKKILSGFQTLDYVKMERLINDALRYNTLLGIIKRNKRNRKEVFND